MMFSFVVCPLGLVQMFRRGELVREETELASSRLPDQANSHRN